MTEKEFPHSRAYNHVPLLFEEGNGVVDFFGENYLP